MVARVCIGQIGAPHGVRGLVVVRAFTEVPEDVAAYGPVSTEDGRVLDISVRGAKKAGLIVHIDGISTREDAAALKGRRIYVDRDRLPEPDAEEFYHADLIGLRAEDDHARPLGRVIAIHDFGAGDLIEIDPGGGDAVMVPFTAETVPEVDIRGGRIVIVAPPGTFPASDTAL